MKLSHEEVTPALFFSPTILRLMRIGGVFLHPPACHVMTGNCTVYPVSIRFVDMSR